MPVAIGADYRSFRVELRAQTVQAEVGEVRHIVGHAAVFNSLSEPMWGFREIILPGAFANAILRSDVRALWNHNPDYILGRTKSGTLSIHEDEIGLAVDITPPDTQFARDLLISIDRGDVDQMSFAFTVKADRWFTDENGDTVRQIVEIDQLFDVSPVAYPAYAETDLSARTRQALAEYRAAVQRHETPMADPERPWDGAAAVRRLREWAGGPDKESVDWAKYRTGFAWYDAEDQESFDSYKLPHHDIIGGKMVVVWKGVSAAMNALMGGRGGMMDMSEADMDGCYSHLAAHYAQFEKDPPERSAPDGNTRNAPDAGGSADPEDKPNDDQVAGAAYRRRQLDIVEREIIPR